MAHNLKVVGSNPTPATNKQSPPSAGFFVHGQDALCVTEENGRGGIAECLAIVFLSKPITVDETQSR